MSQQLHAQVATKAADNVIPTETLHLRSQSFVPQLALAVMDHEPHPATTRCFSDVAMHCSTATPTYGREQHAKQRMRLPGMHAFTTSSYPSNMMNSNVH